MFSYINKRIYDVTYFIIFLYDGSQDENVALEKISEGWHQEKSGKRISSWAYFRWGQIVYAWRHCLGKGRRLSLVACQGNRQKLSKIYRWWRQQLLQEERSDLLCLIFWWASTVILVTILVPILMIAKWLTIWQIGTISSSLPKGSQKDIVLIALRHQSKMLILFVKILMSLVNLSRLSQAQKKLNKSCLSIKYKRMEDCKNLSKNIKQK